MNNILIPENWWQRLETQWKKAFAIITGQSNEPGENDLEKIFSTPVIRLAGPSAPYPNINFELTNLSGIQDLPNLSILIITHHKIESIKEVENLQNLKSLFLYNNKIKSLHGIEAHTELEQLYVQCNCISSIKPVKKLIRLKDLYINDNCIESLEGLTEKHSDTLSMFVCRPNEKLKQKEIIYVERELGIICR